MRNIRALWLTLAFAGLPACASAPTGAMPAGGDLRSAMRTLWAEHVIWTRQYIVAELEWAPSAEQAAARLLRNQEEIGNAIVPCYGQQAGTQLANLLKEHIQIAVQLVAAAKAGNSAGQTAEDGRWRQNADEIATFLSAANPHWPKADLLRMLNDHLNLTTQEAVARLQGNWSADITAFDRIFAQAMEMADALTDGIRRQFPGRA